ncbi:MAG: TldD/PmbA family protein [Candidatus Pacearchaeota archaeon]|jgi:predicted Zn-dependent protease
MNKRDEEILRVLKRELKNLEKMTLSDPLSKKRKISPFFVSITLKDSSSYQSELSEGATIISLKRDPDIKTRVQIVVGDYGRGCKGVMINPFFPEDRNLNVFTKFLRRDANESFYEAVKELQYSITDSIGVPDEFNSFSFFSKEKKSKYYSNKIRFQIKKIKEMEVMLKELSKKFIHPEIYSSEIGLKANKTRRYFINSEGTEIVDDCLTSCINLEAIVRDETNLLLENGKTFNVRDPKNFPSKENLEKTIKNIIKESIKIKNSPIQEAGIYPTLMDGINCIVNWHEAIGHGLEAQRTSDDEDEDEDNRDLTFYKKIGERIAPDFIKVTENPRLKGYYGSYEYDEEGIPSQETILVENGILKNYLHSRSTTGKFTKKYKIKTKSNGHSRSEKAEDPVPRMGVLKVESKRVFPFKKLKEMFIEECKRKKAPYGILLQDTWGGFTLGGYFNAFPKNIFKVYQNGKTERVRGIYISSTPYQLLEKIEATSDEYSVSEGHCGAESGTVPFTGIGQDAFFKSVEFGRIPREEYNQAYPLLLDI